MYGLSRINEQGSVDSLKEKIKKYWSERHTVAERFNSRWVKRWILLKKGAYPNPTRCNVSPYVFSITRENQNIKTSRVSSSNIVI